MPSASLVKEFENLIGKENVFTSEADRQSYAYDAAVLPSVVPGLVLRPTSTEQLGALIERCYANGLPMTIRGAGTNLSGGTVPDADKSVVILTQGLNKIIEINEEDLFAIVEPGVVTAQVAAAVASKGLFYPPDPGSQAVSTIGGNIAENAGGLRGLKYGVTKDYVMGLEFYDHTGELVKSGSRTVKCATGYNLGGLLVGSEGTLGMISRAILKLVPPPQASKAMMAVFDNVQKASEAVARIIAAHILPCTLEFMDNMTINLATYQVTVGGEPLDFTYLEYALLAFLVTHPGRTYSRDALLRRVWGFDYYGGSRTVDVHVRRVRAKLGPELSQHLETVRGVGYLWSA